MKKILLLLLVLGTLYLGRVVVLKPVTSAEADQGPLMVNQEQKISQLAVGPIELDLPVNETGALNTREQICVQERQFLFDHSLLQVLEQLQHGSFIFATGCLKPELGLDTGVCHDFAARSPRTREWGRERARCHRYLFVARAQQLARITADWDHYDSMEPSVLVNKILSLMIRAEGLRPGERDEWRRMTEALVRRHPKSLEALKIHLTTFTADLGPDSFGPDSELRGWIDQGLRLDPHDAQLIELYLDSEQWSEDAEERLQDFVRLHPESANGHYHLAAVYWQKKNRVDCLLSLREAVARDPRNPRFRKTLNLARNSRIPLTRKIFTVQIGFSFDPFSALSDP